MSPKRTARTLVLIWLVLCLPLPAQAETSKPLKTITNSIGMSLVRIEPGEFWMGNKESAEELTSRFKDEGATPESFASAYPRHKVRITKPFYMGTYEVTKGEFRKFVEATNYQTEAERGETGGGGLNEAQNKFERGPRYTWQNTGWKPYDDTHPVVNVSWNDTQRFCKWLSSQEKTAYRLPTEAEWEYACRAGTETLFWNGDAPENLTQVANVRDLTAIEKFPMLKTMMKTSDGYACTAPVGSYPANPWGLHDMHGNVTEWTADVYDFNAYRNRAGTTTVDPFVTSGAESLPLRVWRGGSWGSLSMIARSAVRLKSTPDYRYYDAGFRVVAAAGP
jgi:formylglycine-generating enzyme required for sulfatase activity